MPIAAKCALKLAGEVSRDFPTYFFDVLVYILTIFSDKLVLCQLPAARGAFDERIRTDPYFLIPIECYHTSGIAMSLVFCTFQDPFVLTCFFIHARSRLAWRDRD